MLFFMSTSVERELGDAETKFTDLVAERLLAHQFNPLGAWLLTEMRMHYRLQQSFVSCRGIDGINDVIEMP